jgi:hypothetical protein
MPGSPYETTEQLSELAEPRRSVLELEGLGEEIWQGVDVEEYLRKERSSWTTVQNDGGLE